MSTRFQVIEGINLRARLLRRAAFRLWKSGILSKAKAFIDDIKFESPEVGISNMPAIILSSFDNFSDFMVLSYLFRDKDLTFIETRGLPPQRTLDYVRSLNRVLSLDNEQADYGFFKNLLSALRDFNRSVVISPDAADRYAKHLAVDPVVIVRIAMAANVPITPVRINWQEKREHQGNKIRKCDVWIGRNIYVSPGAEEFRDIFFRQRGGRKFRNLPHEDLKEIGARIISKLRDLGKINGAYIQ